MKGGMMYEQRDIILIPFPYSDLTKNKLRPAIIISNKKLNRTSDRICCLITSNPTAKGITIQEKHLEKGKLPFQSKIKPQRIFTVEKTIIRKKLNTITKKLHEEIIEEINNYLI